jgi:hypothetical protein
MLISIVNQLQLKSNKCKDYEQKQLKFFIKNDDMNTSVSFELAKLLKEKGFKQPCFYYYDIKGKLHEPYLENGSSSDVEFSVYLTDLLKYHNSYPTQHTSAPIISEVVMWLYEKNGIWISVIQNEYEDKFQYTLTQRNPESWRIIDNGKLFNSPTEAYEAAITYILNKLI